MDTRQSSQLEAFRRLLTDEFLINGLLAKGVGSQADGNPQSNSRGWLDSLQSKLTGKTIRNPAAKSKTSHAPSRVRKNIGTPLRSSLSSSQVFRKQNATSKSDHLPKSIVAESPLLAPPANNPKARADFIQRAQSHAGLAGHYNNDFDELEDVTDGVPRKFLVGLDYGTTFTTVSYFAYPADDQNPRAFPSDVQSIMNWPLDGNSGVRKQVPTESWYSPTTMHRPSTDKQYHADSDMEDDEMEDDGQESQAQKSHAPPGVQDGLGAADRMDNPDMDNDESKEYLWGYQVPFQRYRANTTRNEIRRIERPKLMLVNSRYSRHTQDDRDKLRPRLNHLIEKGLIRKCGKKDQPNPRDVQDVITDFLIKVFAHTKQQLVENEGFTDESLVEFVLTVPAIWSPNSSRVLQYAVEAAIKATGFGTLGHGSVENLFIISEPEAAATYLLGSSHDMLAGETFVVLDCGGGTVDGVTYTVTSSYPLQLKIEVGRPEGDNCGGSYLNDNFEKRLLERLKDEVYLDQMGETRESIIRHLIPDFEDYDKRNRDIAKRPSSRIKILGLLGDNRRGLSGSNVKRFEDNFINLNSDDYNEIFLPLLQRVAKVLRTQLQVAISHGKEVKKVFLIGGFAAAPSLKSYLAKFLVDFTRESKLPYDINMITGKEQESVTAIASGAVLRALNKAGGPKRTSFSSYGFLRVEPYQPKICEAHREAIPTRDEVDDEDYVTAIEYFMVKGTEIPAMHEYEPFKSCHTFEVDNPKLLCEEVLYVSDFATESHYPLDHPNNRDVQIAGKIITDMTFLRERNIILPTFPVPDEDGEIRGKIHYRVEYDLVAIVEGRNLRYEARYPADHTGTARNTGQISIAAAFKPGTG